MNLWKDLYRRADFFYCFAKEGPNPYPYMLAAADRAIAPSSSMSTPSDFIAARLPVALTPKTNTLFHEHLVSQGLANWLGEQQENWPAVDATRPLPCDIMRTHIYDLLHKKFGVRFS